MWDTLESLRNSPGERRRVDLGSSRRRSLPFIPVAPRLLLQPPTVNFNHRLHHPSPLPLVTSIQLHTDQPFRLTLVLLGATVPTCRPPPNLQTASASATKLTDKATKCAEQHHLLCFCVCFICYSIVVTFIWNKNTKHSQFPVWL